MRNIFSASKDIFAADAARDGGSGAKASCPGQGWDGPGHLAGVFPDPSILGPQLAEIHLLRVLISYYENNKVIVVIRGSRFVFFGQ